MLASIGNCKGNSLVELLISMGLGMASITAMASLVGHGIGLNASLLAKSRLDEEVNAVLAVISQEVRRAGYQGLTEQMVENSQVFIDPFANKILVTAYPNETSESCINFAYDRNKNGLLDTAQTNENYGYRLKNNAVEIRLDGLACDQNGWHDLTDPQVIKVTELHFEIDRKQVLQLSQTRIHISMHAYLAKHPDISRYVQSTVVLENYE
jgi:prepilin peptidase dependent protein B